MSDIVDVCIVGAGLSGAYAAHLLLADGKSVSVVDARDRVGGRLLTAEGPGGGADLGGAWIWPRSEPDMMRFVRELGAETVPMHLEGETTVRTHDGRRRVLPPGEATRYAACGGGAVRVSGGAAGMVQKLLRSDQNPNLAIHLGMRVVHIEHGGDGVNISCTKSKSNKDCCETSVIKCRTAILAAPPKVIAHTIGFHPSLPTNKGDSMIATPTWMEDYGKVSVSFHQNWWRRLKRSAISIDQIGAVSTWWEASSGYDGDGSSATLAGFVTADGAKDLKKLESAEALHDYVTDTMQELYGIDTATMGMQKDVTDVTISGSPGEDGLIVSKGGVTVTYKSWMEDPYTNNSDQNRRIDFTCDYGDRYLQQSIGPLFFAGTESAPGSGHMEGAIIAARRAADEVMQYLG